jgi:peptidoglycan biosynthesis protein MviN/MurJ (putative lipid II flippase)
MGGLALGNSLATGLEMIGLFILMRRRLLALDQKSIINALRVSLVAVVLMGGIVYFWMQIMKDASPWLVAVGGIVSGGILYVIMLYILRVPELRTIQAVIMKRFRSGG